MRAFRLHNRIPRKPPAGQTLPDADTKTHSTGQGRPVTGHERHRFIVFSYKVPFRIATAHVRLKNKAELVTHLAQGKAQKRHSDDSSLAACTRPCHAFSYVSGRLQLSGLGLEPEGRASSPLLPSPRPIAFCIDCNVVCCQSRYSALAPASSQVKPQR